MSEHVLESIIFGIFLDLFQMRRMGEGISFQFLHRVTLWSCTISVTIAGSVRTLSIDTV